MLRCVYGQFFEKHFFFLHIRMSKRKQEKKKKKNLSCVPQKLLNNWLPDPGNAFYHKLHSCFLTSTMCACRVWPEPVCLECKTIMPFCAKTFDPPLNTTASIQKMFVWGFLVIFTWCDPICALFMCHFFFFFNPRWEQSCRLPGGGGETEFLFESVCSQSFKKGIRLKRQKQAPFCHPERPNCSSESSTRPVQDHVSMVPLHYKVFAWSRDELDTSSSPEVSRNQSLGMKSKKQKTNRTN